MTGSIGVTGGKFSLQDMWGKLGINWDGVAWGDNAALWSINRPYSPSEAARVNMMMDDVYEHFIALVAEGREMTPAQVEAVARGRVWTGSQAAENGLVDGLGGLDSALDYAAGLLGLNNRHDLNVVLMPRPKTAMEKILELLEHQVRMGAWFDTHSGLFDKIGAAAGRLGLAQEKGDGPVSLSAPLPEWAPAK